MQIIKDDKYSGLKHLGSVVVSTYSREYSPSVTQGIAHQQEERLMPTDLGCFKAVAFLLVPLLFSNFF